MIVLDGGHIAIVGEEDFFQRWLLDFNVHHIACADSPQDWIKIPGQLELEFVAVSGNVRYTMQRGECADLRRLVELDSHPAEVAVCQFGDRFYFLELAATQNRHPVTDLLHFVEYVR